MRIHEFEFQLICNLEPEVGADGAIFVSMPQQRYKNIQNLPLNAYGAGPFCRFRIPQQLVLTGVYALEVDDVVKYIGECANLSKRFNSGYGSIQPRNCFVGGQVTNCRLNSQILLDARKGRKARLWFHATPDHKQIEKALLATRKFEWNRRSK